MTPERQWSDPQQLHALSHEALSQALHIWQQSLERYQRRVVETAMDLECLQQEQARREHLRASFGPKEGDTPTESEPTQEDTRILSFVRPPQ